MTVATTSARPTIATIARAALEAGAHIYCEKPFVRFPAEADDVLKLATKMRKEARRAALDELTQLDQQLGLYDA